MTPAGIKMGSDESHFNVSSICEGWNHKTVSTNYNLSEEKGESTRNRDEALLLPSLTAYRKAKPAHKTVSTNQNFSEYKWESKQNWAEALLLTSLTPKLQALVYDILWRKAPESDARSVPNAFTARPNQITRRYPQTTTFPKRKDREGLGSTFD